MGNIGYCCINLSLNVGKRKKDQVLVNRGMVRKTFDLKGLDYVSELIILNLKDTLKVIDWNIKNNIYVYRMSSDSFPWMSEYIFDSLPNFNTIKDLLKQIGDKAKYCGMRLSYHPGPFNVLPSERQEVIFRAIAELDQHAYLMDLIGLEQTTYYPINIHVGTTKPTTYDAAKKFCQSFQLLSNSCKKRLTIENDDSPNQFSVKMLYDWVHKEIGIPIVFDQHHFNYGPQDQTMEEALRLAISTWGDVKPLTHMSSPKTLEDITSKQTAHADYIYEEIQTFGLDFDTEIEAKAKDLAVGGPNLI
ncbi:MAG: UV DNA damage repair endonuclease UvsE [Verrucomicrobia bacterium]|nr:UV DNA damage repair endonuclease UvsE [Verrucomicrobiota bacterium]